MAGSGQVGHAEHRLVDPFVQAMKDIHLAEIQAGLDCRVEQFRAVDAPARAALYINGDDLVRGGVAAAALVAVRLVIIGYVIAILVGRTCDQAGRSQSGGQVGRRCRGCSSGGRGGGLLFLRASDMRLAACRQPAAVIASGLPGRLVQQHDGGQHQDADQKQNEAQIIQGYRTLKAVEGSGYDIHQASASATALSRSTETRRETPDSRMVTPSIWWATSIVTLL